MTMIIFTCIFPFQLHLANDNDNFQLHLSFYFSDFMIAGHTTDYVNKVVRAVEAGNPTGGIEIRASRSYPEELHN